MRVCWFSVLLVACGGGAPGTAGRASAAVPVENATNAVENATMDRAQAPTIGGWYFASSVWPAFFVGAHAGVFDPNRGAVSWSVAVPGAPLAFAHPGNTGRALLTRDETGVLTLWKAPGTLVRKHSSPLLARGREGRWNATFDANDRRVLITISDDDGTKELRLWDLAGTEQILPTANDCAGSHDSFAPGDRFVELHCEDYEVAVYDTFTRRIAFTNAEGNVWTRDGRRVASRDDYENTLLIDPIDGAPPKAVKDFIPDSFSPNGRFLFGWQKTPSQAVVVDAKTQTRLASWPVPNADALSHAWSPANELAVTMGIVLTFWSKGSRPKAVPLTSRDLQGVQASNDGTRFLTDGAVWEFRKSKPTVTLEHRGKGVDPDSFSFDDTFVYGRDDDPYKSASFIWRTVDGSIHLEIDALDTLAPRFGSTWGASWASASSRLFANQEESPWLVILDAGSGRIARVAAVETSDGFAFVTFEGEDCYEGPEDGAIQLDVNPSKRRICPGLLAGLGQLR